MQEAPHQGTFVHGFFFTTGIAKRLVLFVNCARPISNHLCSAASRSPNVTPASAIACSANIPSPLPRSQLGGQGNLALCRRQGVTITPSR